MARGTTLAELRAMLKAEAGIELDEAVSSADDARLNRLIANQQQWLAGEWHWPFLDTTVLITIQPGVRYYTVPTDYLILDQLSDHPQTVYWQRLYHDAIYGIFDENYNVFDPLLDERSDPIERWQVTDYGGQLRIEVWPIPATSQVLRVRGQRPLKPLTADNHVCDLDDLLIVLFSAAEILARENRRDSEAKLAKAQRLLGRLKANYPHEAETWILGGGPQNSWRKRNRRPTVATMIGDTILNLEGGGNMKAGSVDLNPDEDYVQVLFDSPLPRAPMAPGLNVSSPPGGENIFPTLVEGTLNSIGFAVTLSSAPQTTGFKLYYQCVY